jgi:hypothetical protein
MEALLVSKRAYALDIHSSTKGQGLRPKATHAGAVALVLACMHHDSSSRRQSNRSDVKSYTSVPNGPFCA